MVVHEVTGDSPGVSNSAAEPDAVTTVSTKRDVGGGDLRHPFPPHSFTAAGGAAGLNTGRLGERVDCSFQTSAVGVYGQVGMYTTRRQRTTVRSWPVLMLRSAEAGLEAGRGIRA